MYLWLSCQSTPYPLSFICFMKSSRLLAVSRQSITDNAISVSYTHREATVSSVKREYEAKGRELDRRIGEAAKQSASLKSERQSISEDIEQRATAKYLDQKKELDRKFKAQTASYDSFLLGLLLYGVLTTVFTAVRSEAFVSDFKTFFVAIWQFIVNAFQLLLKGF